MELGGRAGSLAASIFRHDAGLMPSDCRLESEK
jgi:hypothetical protein